jgi:hypothetical protein
MKLRLGLLTVALFFSVAASAQPAPLSTAEPLVLGSPAQIPLPMNGCVWAGRSFSEGAQFCVAARAMETCTSGKWTITPSEACSGSPPADTK